MAHAWLQVLDLQQRGVQQQGLPEHGAQSSAPDAMRQRSWLQRNLTGYYLN